MTTYYFRRTLLSVLHTGSVCSVSHFIFSPLICLKSLCPVLALLLTGWPACHPTLDVHHSHAALFTHTFPGNRQQAWRSWGPGASHTLWIKAEAESTFGAKSHCGFVQTGNTRSYFQMWPAKWPLVYCLRDCFASAQMKTPMLLLSTVNIFKIYIYIF